MVARSSGNLGDVDRSEELFRGKFIRMAGDRRHGVGSTALHLRNRLTKLRWRDAHAGEQAATRAGDGDSGTPDFTVENEVPHLSRSEADLTLRGSRARISWW